MWSSQFYTKSNTVVYENQISLMLNIIIVLLKIDLSGQLFIPCSNRLRLTRGRSYQTVNVQREIQ